MSDRINDGGPAFPKAGYMSDAGDGRRHENTGEDGMSLRDWFAGQAPTEPQPWFEPVFTTPIPEYPVWDGMDPNGFKKLLMKHETTLRQLGYEKEQARLAQWPYAWADALLAEREKKSANNG